MVTQESQVNKDGQPVNKRFVLLSVTNSNSIQQLKFHLPAVHIYSIKKSFWRHFTGKYLISNLFLLRWSKDRQCTNCLFPVPILMSFPLRYFVVTFVHFFICIDFVSSLPSCWGYRTWRYWKILNLFLCSRVCSREGGCIHENFPFPSLFISPQMSKRQQMTSIVQFNLHLYIQLVIITSVINLLYDDNWMVYR